MELIDLLPIIFVAGTFAVIVGYLVIETLKSRRS